MSTFAVRKMDPESRDEQNRRLARLTREAHLLDPKRAHALATTILRDVLDNGIDYGDFQSARAAERFTRKAVRALEGLS